MNRNKWQFKFVLSAVFLTAASTIAVIPSPSLAEEQSSDWGYGGASNSTRWGELSSEFETCELGRDQSPIDVSVTEEGESTEIEFDYESTSNVEVVDNGKTIEVDYEPGNNITIKNEVYELVQFHFHTPSEHTIDNESSAMELHLVHQNEAGELAVIGILMEAGAENDTIASIWSAIPSQNKAAQNSGITIDTASLLPEDKTFVSYDGSLTTPPCNEQVNWNLLLEPIELSVEQIETFESLYPYNARPIQPLNGRSIELHE